MFTAETLEQSWKQMREYEREHFGLKFGEDFPVIAQILRSNEQFLSLGMITCLLGSLEMSGLHKEFEGKSETEKSNAVHDMMKKPGMMHSMFAELFYLGYKLGKADGEMVQLEKLATSTSEGWAGPR